MEESKKWYLSRTIWSGLVTSIVAILVGFGVLPDTVTSTVADEVALALLGVATVSSRVFASKTIEKGTNV